MEYVIDAFDGEERKSLEKELDVAKTLRTDHYEYVDACKKLKAPTTFLSSGSSSTRRVKYQ